MSKPAGYYLYYVEDSTPKMKKFRTYKALERFIDKFHINLDSGSWLEFYFLGEPKYLDPHWRGVNE